MKTVLLLILVIHFSFHSSAIAQTSLSNKQCTEEVGEIRDKIKNSLSCKQVEDCIIESFGCPFSCATAINKQSIEEVRQLVVEYNKSTCSQCKYKCATRERKVVCEKGQCALSFETAPVESCH